MSALLVEPASALRTCCWIELEAGKLQMVGRQHEFVRRSLQIVALDA